MTTCFWPYHERWGDLSSGALLLDASSIAPSRGWRLSTGGHNARASGNTKRPPFR